MEFKHAELIKARDCLEKVCINCAVLGVNVEDMPKLFGYISHLIMESRQVLLLKEAFEISFGDPIVDYKFEENSSQKHVELTRRRIKAMDRYESSQGSKRGRSKSKQERNISRKDKSTDTEEVRFRFKYEETQRTQNQIRRTVDCLDALGVEEYDMPRIFGLVVHLVISGRRAELIRMVSSDFLNRRVVEYESKSESKSETRSNSDDSDSDSSTDSDPKYNDSESTSE